MTNKWFKITHEIVYIQLEQFLLEHWRSLKFLDVGHDLFFTFIFFFTIIVVLIMIYFLLYRYESDQSRHFDFEANLHFRF